MESVSFVVFKGMIRARVSTIKGSDAGVKQLF